MGSISWAWRIILASFWEETKALWNNPAISTASFFPCFSRFLKPSLERWSCLRVHRPCPVGSDEHWLLPSVGVWCLLRNVYAKWGVGVCLEMFIPWNRTKHTVPFRDDTEQRLPTLMVNSTQKQASTFHAQSSFNSHSFNTAVMCIYIYIYT